MLIALCCALTVLRVGVIDTVLKAGRFEVRLDQRGYMESARIGDSPNLVPQGHASPLLSLQIDGKLMPPVSSRWNAKNGILSLDYGAHRAEVRITERAQHLVFEISKVRPAKDVDVAVWGSYATGLGDQIGETIGVVQGRGYAIGLQVLNPKTLGGFPHSDDDVEHGFRYPDPPLAPGGKSESYRGDTAKPTPFGSVIQAYVRNRSATRVISNWGHSHYTAPAYRDGGLIGSKIALFGCAAPEALATIGAIEQEEGLPHPMMDGVWAKMNPTAHESYLIMPYDVANLDRYLAITKAAGLRYLYSPDDGFETWGHFELRKERFPDNWSSLKECVDRARKQGVRLGIHTLSNFITTNDPYVTPIPDRRLAEVGSSKLKQSVSADATEVEIEDPTFFNQMSNNTLRTVRVGYELIQYDSVTSSAPWKLLKCKRGAFGTHADVHLKGDRITKLMDHGYGTFLTDTALSVEVAQTIARLFNECGLEQLSMDGLEGNWSTGMGQYGPALFAKAWYDHLSPSLRGQVIKDASMPGAYIWHIQTRDNWGEPWYAGFRQSQTEYRLDNQRYFRRNLMPGMLGWFSLTSETSLEDIQWLLARSAGFDAGFCLVTNLDAITGNSQSPEILAAVHAWESARREHVFPAEVLHQLQSVNEEFELSQAGPRQWILQKIESQKFAVSSGPFEATVTLGGDSDTAKLIFQIPHDGQVSGWSLAIDGVGLKAETLGTDAGYRRIEFKLPHLTAGEHRIRFEGKIAGTSKESANLEFRSPLGEPRVLGGRRRLAGA